MSKMPKMDRNKNAEKWTLKESEDLFTQALELSRKDPYDFIGEVARDLDVYRELFVYLSNKYEELKPIHRQILNTLEANCFSHSKKGKIKEATAIVNLKSNYGWTDRTDLTSKGEKVVPPMFPDVQADQSDK